MWLKIWFYKSENTSTVMCVQSKMATGKKIYILFFFFVDGFHFMILYEYYQFIWYFNVKKTYAFYHWTLNWVQFCSFAIRASICTRTVKEVYFSFSHIDQIHENNLTLYSALKYVSSTLIFLNGYIYLKKKKVFHYSWREYSFSLERHCDYKMVAEVVIQFL